jgi:hypothetical protein
MRRLPIVRPIAGRRISRNLAIVEPRQTASDLSAVGVAARETILNDMTDRTPPSDAERFVASMVVHRARPLADDEVKTLSGSLQPRVLALPQLLMCLPNENRRLISSKK